MELKETIEILSAMSGVSGCERGVTAWLAEYVRPLCDEVYTDVMGNLIAVKKCGIEGAKRVLVDAHIDEIGLIVTGIEHGFLRFAPVGGVDARVLPATQVVIQTEPPIRGVIDSMPPHILNAADMEKPFPMDSLVIDIGMTREQAEALVPLGTCVSFDVQPVMLGEHRLCGKSLDDRACAAIICSVMERLRNQPLNADVYYLFSTQEEVGRRGAQAGVYGIAPDYAVVLDVTHAKTPDARGIELLELNKGPAIGIGPNMTHGMTKALTELATELKMPYQMEVLRGDSGTNAWAIQISRCGVATALVSLPLRYMHTPHELIDLRDAEAIVELVSAYISRF